MSSGRVEVRIHPLENDIAFPQSCILGSTAFGCAETSTFHFRKAQFLGQGLCTGRMLTPR